MAGTLLRKDSLETLWTDVTEGEGEYGYGAEIAHYNGTRVVGHGGGWKGITNRFEMYPERGYTVVILSSYDDDPNAIAYKLREWLMQCPANEKPTPPTPPAGTDAGAEAHAGRDPDVHLCLDTDGSGDVHGRCRRIRPRVEAQAPVRVGGRRDHGQLGSHCVNTHIRQPPP